MKIGPMTYKILSKLVQKHAKYSINQLTKHWIKPLRFCQSGEKSSNLVTLGSSLNKKRWRSGKICFYGTGRKWIWHKPNLRILFARQLTWCLNLVFEREREREKKRERKREIERKRERKKERKKIETEKELGAAIPSSVDSSMPTILRSRVRILSTPSNYSQIVYYICHCVDKMTKIGRVLPI